MIKAFINMSSSLDNKSIIIDNFGFSINEIDNLLKKPENIELSSGGCIKNKIYYKKLLKL
jgi:hypothetical protein